MTILAYFLASFLVFGLQQIAFERATAYGLVVPDTVSITRTLQAFWEQYDLLRSDNEFRTITYLYGWTWFVHPSLCFVVNALLVVCSIACFEKTFIVRLKLPRWTLLGLLGNPYLVLVMPGPNKEIPLLLLTLCLADALLRDRKRWWLAAFLCLLMYTLRDGYGLLLLVIVGGWLLLGRREHWLPALVLGAGGLGALLWVPLSKFVPAMSRNLSVYAALASKQEAVGALASLLGNDPLSAGGGLLMFFLRMLYNLVSLALFPVLVTHSGDVYWIGVSYWICGLLCLACWSGCLWNWMSKLSRPDHMTNAASLSLCVWIGVSLSLYVQPRYLMPLLPVAFAATATLGPRQRASCSVLAVGLALSVMSVYSLIGRSPKPVVPKQFTPPAYVLRIQA